MNNRWEAQITYAYDAGPVIDIHDIEELEEIAEIVESGPHWDTVRGITITLRIANPSVKNLTVEKARDL